MDYARDNGFVVFTHDLDFGNILAVTHALGPSVIQARVEDPVPATIGDAVAAAIAEHAGHLEKGALITLDPESLADSHPPDRSRPACLDSESVFAPLPAAGCRPPTCFLTPSPFPGRIRVPVPFGISAPEIP